VCVAGNDIDDEGRSALEEARTLRSNLTIDYDDEEDYGALFLPLSGLVDYS
jgi:hypothetical protein